MLYVLFVINVNDDRMSVSLLIVIFIVFVVSLVTISPPFQKIVLLHRLHHRRCILDQVDVFLISKV